VERFMTGSAARDQGDLALPGAAAAQDEVLGEVDLDEVGMRRLEPGEALGDDVLDRVDELLHPAGCVGRHGILLGVES
jgi:hypothetical protein